MGDKAMVGPKVLVGSPTFEGMEYCLGEFIERMRVLDYPNYDIILVDNSKGDGFFIKLKKEKGIQVIKDDTQETSGVKRVISSRNKMLQYAIKKNYDYVLMMDCDVIPPKSIIRELISCKKDIVSGLYFNIFHSNGKLKWLPCAWKEVSQEIFDEMKKRDPSKLKGYESPEGMTEYLTKPDAESGKLLKVAVPCGGCMLLSKAVFEKISYEMPENAKPGQTDEICFLEKARKAGFQPYCYTKLKCEHLVSGKYKGDSNGKLRHPLHLDSDESCKNPKKESKSFFNYYQMARCFLHIDSQKAIELLKKSIKLNPKFFKAWQSIGGMYIKTGQFDKAEEALLKAVELKPNSSSAHQNLGIAYSEQGNYTQAIKEFIIAIKLSPNNADAYFNLGLAYKRRGHDSDNIAYKAFKKAIELNPEYKKKVKFCKKQ